MNAQIEGLQAALKESPNNMPLRKMLADAYIQIQMYTNAENEFKFILLSEPNNNAIKLQLANCYLLQQKNNVALVIVEELLDQNKQNDAALLLYSKIFFAQGDFKNAKINLDKAKQNGAHVDDEYNAQLQDKLITEGLAIPSFNIDELDELLENSSLEKSTINFEDVGGMQKVKDEIAMKVIHPITHPEIYKAFNKKAGGGILLYGPPGCGKTMLARATAGEINANFISVSINDILDMWIGSSEQNLHDLFEQARLNAPCVLFFDEVDALGASRNDMRKAAGRFLINQFLDELDGLKYSNEGVLILGATNCPWFLDAAFRRPGRFDRIIFVTPPDLVAREEIINLLIKNVPTQNIDTLAVAKLTAEYSGADLKAVVDIAIELKLPESLKLGKVIPVTNQDIKIAIAKHMATTKEWFATAKNYALYSNESGLYNEILTYLKIDKH
jgi:transitional endoplasmic reticulum ATPase